jgi:hypothetical protein
MLAGLDVLAGHQPQQPDRLSLLARKLKVLVLHGSLNRVRARRHRPAGHGR